jgi:hypothetical protein
MRTFYGWRVVGAAFVLAAFGWGIGFYGPPVFLRVICETRGWSLATVSAAVTAHFLVGAAVGANLPQLHRWLGAAGATKAAALSLALGVVGWATAAAPWQLFVASLLSGAGWSAMSAAAVNAIVSPWFVRRRPAALAMAYNGGSIGGVIFSPLWVAAIGCLGFPAAAAAIGATVALTMWILADQLLSRTPAQMGLAPDGDAAHGLESYTPHICAGPPPAQALTRWQLWGDWKFLTLAAGMALGLFAQIGLMAHLFSLLAPVLGAQEAGLALGLATALAIGGRTLTGWLMPVAADRRLPAGASYLALISAPIAPADLVVQAGSDLARLRRGERATICLDAA